MDEYSNHAMVCLYPPADIAEQLAIEGGIAPEELHVTLAYLGEVEGDTPNDLIAELARYAAQWQPIEASLNGLGRFFNEDPNAFWLNVDSPDLPGFRRGVVECCQMCGCDPVLDHGYTPHMTLAEIAANKNDLPFTRFDPVTVTFDSVSLKWQGNRYDLPLSYEAETLDIAVEEMIEYLYEMDDEIAVAAADNLAGYAMKAGRRNSRSDAQRIAAIDTHAKAIQKLTRELGYSNQLKSVPEKYSHIDFSVTDQMKRNAQRALDKRKEKPESERGMTPVGIARARDISNGSDLSPDTWRRMLSYFQRHEVDKKGETWGEYGKGRQAWDGWGGDAGYARARKIVGQMDAADEKDKQGKTASVTVEGNTFVDVEGNRLIKFSPVTSNALKAISKTDDELVVGNYMVLWGGRDLEGTVNHNRNPDGSAGEYFTPETDFTSEYTKNVGWIPVDWEHRADPHGPRGDDLILGKADMTTAQIDDRGLWVQRVLNRRNEYVKMLESLIEQGVIGTSSEAAPDRTVKAADGRIVRWPLVADTLTVSPMEPRMIDENTLRTLKALADKVPAVAKACEGLFCNSERQKNELMIARMQLKRAQGVMKLWTK